MTGVPTAGEERRAPGGSLLHPSCVPACSWRVPAASQLRPSVLLAGPCCIPAASRRALAEPLRVLGGVGLGLCVFWVASGEPLRVLAGAWLRLCVFCAVRDGADWSAAAGHSVSTTLCAEAPPWCQVIAEHTYLLSRTAYDD